MVSTNNCTMESDKNKNQESIMDDRMSVSHFPGYAMNSGAVAPQRPEAMDFFPFVQYPIDDTLPVESWLFELPVRPAAQDPFKPLRPEVERAAIEAINRHLPPSERIQILQPSQTGTEVVAHSRRYRRTYLAPAPRNWHGLDRQATARAPGSSKSTEPAWMAENKESRSETSKNWTETEHKNGQGELVAGWEDKSLVAAGPDLIITRPDGISTRVKD